ncbi:hypothetical protein FQA39_LY10553 [Lamprigera yunnana]|nr:hypothetical protein FQA39_LY10553 [Lamprigera yunnana]
MLRRRPKFSVSLLKYSYTFRAIPPQKPTIIDEKGKEVVSVAGPYDEGGDVKLTCIVSGGIPFQNWKDSIDEEETEAASLTESASAIGYGGAYADIWKHIDMRGNDSNENEATTESASANKEGGIGKALTATKRISRHHLGEQRKVKERP